MKRSKSSPLLILSLSVLSLFYISCQKNGGVDPNSPLAHEQAHKDSMVAFIAPIYNIWRIHSITQGGKPVTIDTCNRLVDYKFTSANMGGGSQGYLFISYNSPCVISGMDRTKQPQNITYIFSINPNTLIFPDNGYDLKNNTYNVVKLTADSLILKSPKTLQVRIYLPH